MNKKIRNIVFAVIICTMVGGNVNCVYAGTLSSNHNIAITKSEVKGEASSTHSLGSLPTNPKYYKISVKNPGKMVLKVTGLKGYGSAIAELCEKDKCGLTGLNEMDAKTSHVTYYIRKPGVYYLRLSRSYHSPASAEYTFTPNANQGGTSFSKAASLKKEQKKKGIFGFETKVKEKQYYKFTISKEELVKIKFTKGDSCLPIDTMRIEVYESGNKNKAVTGGKVYEGQKEATLYIRNSKNYKTIPGTYYIVVSKVTEEAAFDYSLTWLKK